METLSAVRAKVGARSPGSCEAAGPGEPKPASSSSPAGRGSPAAATPESHAYRLEDLETLATVVRNVECFLVPSAVARLSA
ncbi:UNVERIFIED_CONTAM: hypothetical protein K2H54_044014 [Gekko kuhli]